MWCPFPYVLQLNTYRTNQFKMPTNFNAAFSAIDSAGCLDGLSDSRNLEPETRTAISSSELFPLGVERRGERFRDRCDQSIRPGPPSRPLNSAQPRRISRQCHQERRRVRTLALRRRPTRRRQSGPPWWWRCQSTLSFCLTIQRTNWPAAS